MNEHGFPETLYFALVEFGIFEGWSDHLDIWKQALGLSNACWRRYRASMGEFPTEAELDQIRA